VPKTIDYKGHELDAETGVHYAGARYYMSALGRWNGPDPLADDFRPPEVFTPAWSPQAYSYNNPIRFLDPTGMAPSCPECQYWQTVGSELRSEWNGVKARWNGVKARVRSHVPTAEQLDEVKQRADDASTYAAGVGAGALGFSLATGLDPSDAGSLPTAAAAFAASDAADAVGFAITLAQAAEGRQNRTKFYSEVCLWDLTSSLDRWLEKRQSSLMLERRFKGW